MSFLGKPQGVFDLSDTDRLVGSFYTRNDLRKILGQKLLSRTGLTEKVVDEQHVHKSLSILPDFKGISFDELVVSAIFKLTFPKAEIQHQYKVRRYKVDLRVSHNRRARLIEFLGPQHFCLSKYGAPKTLSRGRRNLKISRGKK